MSEIIIIVHEHGNVDPRAEVALAGTLVEDLHAALAAAGFPVDDETLLFVEDGEAPLPREPRHGHHGLHHGARVHVGPMREVHVGVHFMARMIEHRFAPGTRVAGVKRWAAKTLGMSPADAAEHVLQIQGSLVKPSPDTPIHGLAEHHGRRLDFDLVPEKRVEG